MTEKAMPPLPEPSFQLVWLTGRAVYKVTKPNIGDTDVFTSDQMHAYAQQYAAQQVAEAMQWRDIETAPKDGEMADHPAAVKEAAHQEDAIRLKFQRVGDGLPPMVSQHYAGGPWVSEWCAVILENGTIQTDRLELSDSRKRDVDRGEKVRWTSLKVNRHLVVAWATIKSVRAAIGKEMP